MLGNETVTRNFIPNSHLALTKCRKWSARLERSSGLTLVETRPNNSFLQLFRPRTAPALFSLVALVPMKPARNLMNSALQRERKGGSPRKSLCHNLFCLDYIEWRAECRPALAQRRPARIHARLAVAARAA